MMFASQNGTDLLRPVVAKTEQNEFKTKQNGTNRTVVKSRGNGMERNAGASANSELTELNETDILLTRIFAWNGTERDK